MANVEVETDVMLLNEGRGKPAICCADKVSNSVFIEAR